MTPPQKNEITPSEEHTSPTSPFPAVQGRTARATPAEVRAQLSDHNREPFLDILSVMMGCMPDEGAITAFAADHPDRWANTVATFAKLGGFHEKMEITKNINVLIGQMGDAELLAQWKESNKNILDLTAQDIVTGEGEEEAN